MHINFVINTLCFQSAYICLRKFYKTADDRNISFLFVIYKKLIII